MNANHYNEKKAGIDALSHYRDLGSYFYFLYLHLYSAHWTTKELIFFFAGVLVWNMNARCFAVSTPNNYIVNTKSCIYAITYNINRIVWMKLTSEVYCRRRKGRYL